MYRTIESSLWTDPKIKKLSPDGKLLFVYLITNTHTHVSGIYYLPMVTISHETGYPIDTLSEVVRELISEKLIKIDPELDVFWVINMFRYQGRGTKNLRSAKNQLESLHKSCLINDFLQAYPKVKLEKSSYPIDRVSSAEPMWHSGTEPETETETRKEESGEPAKPASSPSVSPTVLTFPCIGKREWKLTERKLEEYRETFVGIDVLAECRKALQWCRDNSTRRKTVKGMSRFLGSWLGRAQDRNGVYEPSRNGAKSDNGSKSGCRVPTDEEVKAWRPT